MKERHRSVALPILLIASAAILGTPGSALAMGGEGIAEGLLLLAFCFVVWLIASALSFIPKTKPRTIERYALWAIRLSFPVWIAGIYIDGRYIAPHLSQIREEKREALRIKAAKEFGDLCERHAPQATQILTVVDDKVPKRFYIDQPDELFGLQLSLNLANCVTHRSTAACDRLRLESIEWAWLHSKGFAPCKSGVVPGSDRCLPEYKRYDLGDRKFSVVDIHQPTSEYVIRVDKAVRTGKQLEEVRKYQITLEAKGTSQPLAKVEVLASWAGSPPCPNPSNAVAQMLTQVFPRQ